jgi:hypothetical protein
MIYHKEINSTKIERICATCRNSFSLALQKDSSSRKFIFLKRNCYILEMNGGKNIMDSMCSNTNSTRQQVTDCSLAFPHCIISLLTAASLVVLLAFPESMDFNNTHFCDMFQTQKLRFL